MVFEYQAFDTTAASDDFLRQHPHSSTVEGLVVASQKDLRRFAQGTLGNGVEIRVPKRVTGHLNLMRMCRVTSRTVEKDPEDCVVATGLFIR